MNPNKLQIISSDKCLSLRIVNFAIIHLRGLPTKLNLYTWTKTPQTCQPVATNFSISTSCNKFVNREFKMLTTDYEHSQTLRNNMDD